jgi:hypothetical protein
MAPAPSRPPLPTRARIGLVIGAVMLAFGSYIALHPLWSPAPVTQSRLLDVAFALFFLVKGLLYFRVLRNRPSPVASPERDGD